MVTMAQAIEWMERPTRLQKIKGFSPWQCRYRVNEHVHPCEVRSRENRPSLDPVRVLVFDSKRIRVATFVPRLWQLPESLSVAIRPNRIRPTETKGLTRTTDEAITVQRGCSSFLQLYDDMTLSFIAFIVCWLFRLPFRMFCPLPSSISKKLYLSIKIRNITCRCRIYTYSS